MKNEVVVKNAFGALSKRKKSKKKKEEEVEKATVFDNQFEDSPVGVTIQGNWDDEEDMSPINSLVDDGFIMATKTAKPRQVEEPKAKVIEPEDELIFSSGSESESESEDEDVNESVEMNQPSIEEIKKRIGSLSTGKAKKEKPSEQEDIDAILKEMNMNKSTEENNKEQANKKEEVKENVTEVDKAAELALEAILNGASEKSETTTKKKKPKNKKKKKKGNKKNNDVKKPTVDPKKLVLQQEKARMEKVRKKKDKSKFNQIPAHLLN